jgi:protein farnesyltransferase subunit beta
LDILDEEVSKGVSENIKKCQTFEGGLGPEPFSEAHGGYSFCGIGALVILKKLEDINVEHFIHWLVSQQKTYEGGFSGRTNKLVDSCYSLWQGGVFNMLMNYDKKYSYESEMLYDQLALQAYIIFCCQNSNGGLVDKPGKGPDLFHTNYAMLGLALSQKSCLDDKDFTISLTYDDEVSFDDIDPVFTINKNKLKRAKEYYRNKK